MSWLSQDMIVGAIAAVSGLLTAGAMIVLIRSMASDEAIVARRLTLISTSGISGATEEDEQTLVPRFIVTLLTRAGYPVRPARIYLFIGGVVLLALLLVAAGAATIAPIVLILPPVLAILILQRQARKRFLAFADALPTFIDRMRQLIIVGNNLHQGLAKAVDASAPEIRTLMWPLIWRLNHGSSVPDAVSWFARRMDMTELHLLSAAIATNFRFGGRITDILNSLVETLRARQKILRELRAATAEARATGLVLGSLTPATAALVFAMNPDFITFFFTDPSGPTMLAIILGLQAMGVFLMVRMLKVQF